MQISYIFVLRVGKNQLFTKRLKLLRVIPIYTKFANFAGLDYPIKFRDETLQFCNFTNQNLVYSWNNLLSTIYKMSGRSLSVYKDTSASHEYLCTLIKNGHEFCKLLLKRTQIVVQ